jgi:hypothetical protein
MSNEVNLPSPDFGGGARSVAAEVEVFSRHSPKMRFEGVVKFHNISLRREMMLER